MNQMETARGRAVVMQPDEGRSWWQPMPANGHADPKLVPSDTGFGSLSMGYQTIAPGGRVRPHSHGAQVELQICFRGRGSVVVDGVTQPLVPGTACFLGPDVKHEIVNDGDGDLVMLWVISPAGLEDFFASVGRERSFGEPPPSPFERPTDVVAIERELGMNDTTASAGTSVSDTPCDWIGAVPGIGDRSRPTVVQAGRTPTLRGNPHRFRPEPNSPSHAHCEGISVADPD